MKTTQFPLQFLRHSVAAAAAFGITTVAMSLGMSVSTQAQTCILLEDIDGGGTEITKTVSAFGVLFVRNNWHTDFAVPGGTNFQYFVATILPIEGETYDIDMNLRYSDDTTDEVYTVRGAMLPEGEPLQIRASSRPVDSPFRVNVRVGGTVAEGNIYTVSVMGCR